MKVKKEENTGHEGQRCKRKDSLLNFKQLLPLVGPGIKSRWGRDFPHLSRPALGPTQPPLQWVPGLSQGQRVAGA